MMPSLPRWNQREAQPLMLSQPTKLCEVSRNLGRRVLLASGAMNFLYIKSGPAADDDEALVRYIKVGVWSSTEVFSMPYIYIGCKVILIHVVPFILQR